MKALLILATLFSAQAFAVAESKPLELPVAPKEFSESSTAPKYEATCTSLSGSKTKAGDAGYESCVMSAQQDMANRMQGKNTGTTSTTPSQTFEVKFGK